MVTRTLVVALTLLTTAACATTRRGDTGRNPDVLTRAEIDAAVQTNAYDLVRNARPTWLRLRGPNSFNSPNPILVYLDGVRLGTVESLKSIPVMNVERIRHYDGPEAQARFGLNHTNGAIEITTRNR